jgi:hypothetical protein
MKFRENKVRPLDPRQVHKIDDLARALAGCGFQGASSPGASTSGRPWRATRAVSR